MIARAWPAACWLALCLAGVPARADPVPLVRLQEAGLDPAQREASAALLATVQARLPPRWRQALQDVQPALAWVDDLPAHVHGRANLRRIQLDRRLLLAWQVLPPDRRDAADGPGRAAQAALLHELAHVLDRSAAGGLSRDPRLLDLAGWQVRPWHLGRGGNAFADRSPDRYELRDPAEFVAVNLEHFVLDPDYPCRRPALARWFAQRLQQVPAAAWCATALPFLQAENEDGAVSLLELDPARVYAVDYLLAEGNAQPMSRWGHSMLRLVICAPGRPPGPRCRLDLQYHRVLSFRAFVGDLQISSWRGLTGRYPSRLFLLPLDQVVDEYTRVELRSLSSLPLRLDRAEIDALLERAADVHWRYDGRYYFIGNNCAVETWKLLHDALPRFAAAPLSGITPNGLQRRLARAGLLDEAMSSDRTEAMRQGYYFESAQAQYQAMFALLRERLGLPQGKVEAWLALRPEQRRPWIARADLRTAAAMLLLEQAARRRLELEVRETVKRQMLQGRDAEQARAQVLAVLEQAGALARPASLLDGAGGYGLPQAAEQAAVADAAARRGQRLRQEWSAIRAQARAALPPGQREALAGSEDNLALIGQRLRALDAGT